MSNTPKAVIIYSGGMDSFTLLHLIKSQYQVFALSFHYGQKHSQQELKCAKHVCNIYDIAHKIIDISCIQELLTRSSLTNPELSIPKISSQIHNSTIVPNRNMILISLAISYALSVNANYVFIGVHQDDNLNYPDTRPEFIEAINQVAALCDIEKITIEAPFQKLKKWQILQQGLKMKLNYQDTWTCYNGQPKACGNCHSCDSRLKAFAKCQACDPLEYATNQNLCTL